MRPLCAVSIPQRASPCWALVVGWGAHGQEHRGGGLDLTVMGPVGEMNVDETTWTSTEGKHLIKIFNYFWPHHVALWDLCSAQPGIEPAPPVVEAQSLTTGPGSPEGN